MTACAPNGHVGLGVPDRRTAEKTGRSDPAPRRTLRPMPIDALIIVSFFVAMLAAFVAAAVADVRAWLGRLRSRPRPESRC